jgi:L-aspartate oxidase
MWRSLGVRREADPLREALENVQHWCRYVLARQFNDPSGWELQNMLILARLMLSGALNREESRGAHVRTDFPEPDDMHWARHQVYQRPGHSEALS